MVLGLQNKMLTALKRLEELHLTGRFSERAYIEPEDERIHK